MVLLQAVEMIDGDIKQPFSQLRRRKELQGSSYYDVSPYIQGLTRVPDVLRPKPSGNLSAVQRRVYEVKQHIMNFFTFRIFFCSKHFVLFESSISGLHHCLA